MNELSYVCALKDFSCVTIHNVHPPQLSEIQLERQSCSYCSKKLDPDTLADKEEAIVGSSEEIKPADLNSSRAAYSQLQAMCPSTNGDNLEASDSSLSATLTQQHGD